MYKVFYNPNTLEIKGYSNGELSFELPFVEINQEPLILSNYKIEKTDTGEIVIDIIKQVFSDKDWENVIKNGII